MDGKTFVTYHQGCPDGFGAAALRSMAQARQQRRLRPRKAPGRRRPPPVDIHQKESNHALPDHLHPHPATGRA